MQVWLKSIELLDNQVDTQNKNLKIKIPGVHTSPHRSKEEKTTAAQKVNGRRIFKPGVQAGTCLVS